MIYPLDIIIPPHRRDRNNEVLKGPDGQNYIVGPDGNLVVVKEAAPGRLVKEQPAPGSEQDPNAEQQNGDTAAAAGAGVVILLAAALLALRTLKKH